MKALKCFSTKDVYKMRGGACGALRHTIRNVFRNAMNVTEMARHNIPCDVPVLDNNVQHKLYGLGVGQA